MVSSNVVGGLSGGPQVIADWKREDLGGTILWTRRSLCNRVEITIAEYGNGGSCNMMGKFVTGRKMPIGADNGRPVPSKNIQDAKIAAMKFLDRWSAYLGA